MLPSAISCSINFRTSASALADPWKLTSSLDDDAGYAKRDIASATVLSFPGMYCTSKLNCDRVSCHLARLPLGPDGVSMFSDTQFSSDRWSVLTSTGWNPTHPAHFRSEATMAYVSFSLGVQFS